MISISTITASATGNVIVEEDIASDTGAKTARVTRTATLDGGVYINNLGFTHGDRTLRIRGRISQAKAALLSTIFEGNNSSLISLSDGLYLGSISTLNTQNGSLNMTFLIKNKEN
jgi:hypothetical protein